MAKLALNGAEPIRSKPFPKWPEVNEREEQLVLEVVRSGNWWMYSYGSDEFAGTDQGVSKVEEFEKQFAELQNAKYAYAVTSGTAALEIACRAIGLKPGDEVITTPYTFIATSTCILNAMAIPVYVDIEPETYNLNPDLIEQAITDRTRAIIPVDFSGNICDMDRINAIARRYNLKVIEDAAHCPGASLKENRGAGTLGDIGVFSMQQSKVLTCGEGGVITTNNPELAEMCWSLRHCGRSRTGKWYEHTNLGWNYRMTELQGALLLTQLEKFEVQNQKRRRNVKILNEKLQSVPGITVCEQHPEIERDIYYILLLRFDSSAWDGINRDTVAKALAAEGVPVSSGYNFPLYENQLFENIDFNSPNSPYRTGHDKPLSDFREYRHCCPVTERACRKESLWLTHDVLLGSKEDTEDIFKSFMKVYENREELRGM